MGFFGSFFGSDQRKDMERANAQATASLGAGKAAARQDYSTAQGFYQPYAQQGSRANALYGDALGVNGAGARTAATANFQATSPYSQTGDDYAMQGVLRQMNARGMGSSGSALLAMQRVGSERFAQRHNNWMGQLEGAGQQGLQASAAQAGLQQGMGDIESGYSQQMAGNAINFGNAMAASRTQGINNIMGLGGLAMKAMAPSPSGSIAGNAWNAARGSVNKLWG